MKIAIGCDHAGVQYKEAIAELLIRLGHEVINFGTDSTQSVDYPTIALAVSHAAVDGTAERGIFICGTGIGGNIAANKVRGCRAALCHTEYEARMSREHNNANVLCLGARVLGLDVALAIAHTWLDAAWSGDARHARRLQLIADAERASAEQRPPGN